MTMAEKTEKKSGGIGEVVSVVVQALILALLIRTFLFQPFSIPSGSMRPTLLEGDYLFVSKFAYGYSRHSLPLGLGYVAPESWSGRIFGSRPQPGHVIVVRDPGQRINLIKRVVGLPGDRIEMRGGRLYINGDPVEREPQGVVRYRDRSGVLVEAAVYEETLPNGAAHTIYERTDSGRLDDVGPFIVPENNLFLMGDNRDASADSREASGLGYVHQDEVVGRAWTVLFTFASCREEEGLYCPPWRVWRGL